MSDNSITSVAQYVDRVSSIVKTYNQRYPIVYETPVFRGQADVEFELLPSIARGREDDMSISILSEERNLIEMAKFKMPDIFNDDLKPVELLARLQHHGIPTRLLDITENALVALYFACCDEKCRDKDGEVIVFKDKRENIGNYPIIQAIADTYRICGNGYTAAADFFREAQNFDYFSEQRNMIKFMDKGENHKEFDLKMLDMVREPLFIYAPFSHLRQKMQQGRYILFSNDAEWEDEEVYTTPMISPISKDNKCIAGKITISAAAKKIILQELRMFGISRQTLFADSTDITCEEITQDFLHKIQS